MCGAYRFIFIILPVFLLFYGSAEPADIRQPEIAIVISQPIRPYLIAVEGLRQELSRNTRAKIQEFDLKKFKGKGYDILTEDLKKERFDLFIAIGPSATRFVWSSFPSSDVPKVYTMVLNPESILAQDRPACGITLRIPVKTQLKLISSGLPSVKRLGILQNPLYNAEFVNQAVRYTPGIGLEIIPLDVSSRSDIPVILGKHWTDLNALLFIPDRTVISESIVQHIIKEAILKKVAVIGYNRFFYESGAALAFVLDYREIGRQTGMLAIKMLSGEGCKEEAPIFHAWVNRRVIQKLGIEFLREYKPPLRIGP